MTDDQLRDVTKLRYGDLIALRIFVASRGSTAARPEPLSSEEHRSTLLKRLHENMEARKKEPSKCGKRGSLMVKNKIAKKSTRRIEIGWQHFDVAAKEFKQVRPSKGGGTRHLVVGSGTTTTELLQTAIDIFFPDGVSPKGVVSDFEFIMMSFDMIVLDPEDDVANMYAKKCVTLLRIYLASKPKVST